MNRESIDKWLEWTLLALVLAFLTFGVLALGAVRPDEFVVLQWLAVAILAVWLLRIWMAPRFRFLLPPTAWAILPFVAYAVWSYRTADIEYLARQELIQVIIAAVLFFAVVNNLFAQGAVRILALGLIAVATAATMYGIYQWLTGTNSVWQFVRPGYQGRASGTYICPNHLAGLLEMVTPLAITLTLLRGFGPLSRIFLGYASLVMLVGLAATSSRGGWLAGALGFFILIVVLVRRKTNWWAVLALVLVLGSTGSWLYSRALKPRLEPGPSGKFDDVRFSLWKSSVALWKDHFWFGSGPGHFDYRYRGYREAQSEVQPRPVYAHNDYLNTLADWGLVGLILILTPVLAAAGGVALSWRYLHRSGEAAGHRVALVLGASAGLAALLVHSFFDFNMHIPVNAFVATALLAIITTHWRYASQRYWLTARWPVRLCATVVLAGVGYYLAIQAWQHTSEVRALSRAEKAPEMSEQKLAALESAFRVEPKNAHTALALGEQLRSRAWTGEDEHKQSAAEALEWFKRASQLNIWDPHALIGAGMCLDWMGRHDEAAPYFARALKLDPNHWYTRSMMGWHYFQAGNLPEAERWLRESLAVYYSSTAWTYLELVRKKMAEQADPNRQFRSLPEFN
jgi:tetratricopeptide (TPR) repeat protein